MSDEDLRRWGLSGVAGSSSQITAQAEMNMRSASKIATSAAEMATANRDLVEATKLVIEAHHGIIQQTRNLVWATWGIAAITLFAQVGLIILESLKK